MRFIFLIAICWVSVLQLTGQENKKDKSVFQHFSARVSSGITEGENGTAFQIHLVNGFKIKQWYAGLGAGIDEYYLRTVPVYLSATRYLSSHPSSFFLQGDAGYNFVWDKNYTPRSWNEISNEFKPGIYWNGSFGFSTALGKKQINHLLFSVGYAYKHIEQKIQTQVFCINPPCPPTEEEYSYQLRRVSFNLGWQFNNSNQR